MRRLVFSDRLNWSYDQAIVRSASVNLVIILPTFSVISSLTLWPWSSL